VTHAIGLYGKLPAVGDFVTRGLSAELRDALDGLLQSALMAALGEGVHAHALFAQAPAFVLSLRPGALCGPGFVGGIVPSQDRVGRLFPLCVGLELSPQALRLPLAWPALPLAQTLCGLAIRAQGSAASADQLWAELPDAARWQALSGQGVPFASAEDETLPRAQSDEPAACFAGPEPAMSLIDRALCSRLPWSSQLLGIVLSPTGAYERFFALRAVKEAAPLAAVFDGRWARWGWAEHGLPAPPAAPAVATPAVAAPAVPAELPTVAEIAPQAAADATAPTDEDATRPPLPRIDKTQPPADDAPTAPAGQGPAVGGEAAVTARAERDAP
jgi:type VI secretion system ImpM family protein